MPPCLLRTSGFSLDSDLSSKSALEGWKACQRQVTGSLRFWS